MEKSIWEELGIEPTADQRKIKKAYAKLVKDCHQEDEPQRWQKLHTSYEAAISYAKHVTNTEQAKEDNWEQIQVIQEKNSQGEKIEVVTNQEPIREQVLFLQMENQDVEKQWQLQQSDIKTQIKKILSLPVSEQAQKFCDFLESYQISQFYLMVEFWNMFFQILKKNKLKVSVYRAIVEELVLIQESTYIHNATELRFVIETIKSYCSAQIEKQINQKKKFKRICCVSSVTIIIFLTVFAIIHMVSINQQNGSYSGNEQVQIISYLSEDRSELDVFVDYLNEKYETDNYKKSQFSFEKIQVDGERNGDTQMVLEVGYRIVGIDIPTFCGYILYNSEYETEQEKYICFDNRQIAKIETALSEELRERLGLDVGTAVFDNSVNVNDVSWLQGGDVVCHTKFTGDITSFLLSEQESRKQAFEGYYRNGNTGYSDTVNGCVVFCYPDNRISTLRDRVMETYGEYKEDWTEQLECLEKTEKLQAFFVGMPEEYYSGMFTGDTDNIRKQIDIGMRKNRYNFDFKSPLNFFFITEGYWKPIEIENAKKDTSAEERKKWYHTREVLSIGDGIYVIPREDRSVGDGKGLSVQVKAETNKELGETVFYTEQEDDSPINYIYIIDKKILEIDEFQIFWSTNESANRLDITGMAEVYETLYDKEEFFVLCSDYDVQQAGMLILKWK